LYAYEHRDLRAVHEIIETRFGFDGIRIQSEDDPAGNLQPIAVESLYGLQHVQRRIVFLAHGLQCIALRRPDTDEHGIEACLTHHGKNAGVLGDIERGLAGE
jgi:hypothetical protein